MEFEENMYLNANHRRREGGPCPPNFLENIVICGLRGVFLLNKIVLFA